MTTLLRRPRASRGSGEQAILDIRTFYERVAAEGRIVHYRAFRDILNHGQAGDGWGGAVSATLPM